MKTNRGFTLLEILIALAILSIVSIALLSQSRQSVATRSALHDKTLGLWIAEDNLDTLRAEERWPSIGASSEEVVVNEREWQVMTEVVETAQPNMRRITVGVNTQSSSGELDKPVVELTSFIGRY